jgi:class 3 adenylate cyclase
MLEVSIYNLRQHRQFQRQTGPLMLARADVEQPVWVPVDPSGADVANAVLEIKPHDGGIALAMTGCAAECYCGRKCGLTGACQLEVPARFSIGDTQFEVFHAEQLGPPARPLQKLRAAPATGVENPLKDQFAKQAVEGPSPATLSRWFAALGTLHHWATSLQELYTHAARCAVDAVGLDGAIVLRRRDDEWEIAASHLPHPELGIHCDLRALDELLKSPETMFHGNEGQGSSVENQEPEEAATHQVLATKLSAIDLSEPAVIVSPLCGADGRLLGAIYGYRSVRAGNARRGIRYLEANMIELLAGAVSEGMARLQRESEVDRHRALVEKAIWQSPQRDDVRLVGEEREVTLLFADLRGFTELSSQLANDEMYELLGQVMDALTAAVMDHDGLVIDYYGDGLAAMWNAPAHQSDHPELACRAALKMLDSLPEVAADWVSVLHTAAQLRLGIGIHTGSVQVGNAGSSRHKKYGPRGTNVHVAARVEAATKKLFQPLLVTGPTVRRLSSRFSVVRICKAQLRGIEEPVDLYGIWSTSTAEPENVLDRYAKALALFERGQLDAAAHILRQIDPTTTGLPIEFLAGHIDRELGQPCRRRGDPAPGPLRGILPIDGK